MEYLFYPQLNLEQMLPVKDDHDPYHTEFNFPQKSGHLLWFSLLNFLKDVLSCHGGLGDKDCVFICHGKPMCRSENSPTCLLYPVAEEQDIKVFYSFLQASVGFPSTTLPICTMLLCPRLHQLI